MMTITTPNKTTSIVEITPDQLDRYAQIPITFTVDSIFEIDLIEQGLGGFRLREVQVDPYIKDYDHEGGEDTSPTSWSKEFDMSRWGFFLAVESERTLGAAAVAFNTHGVNMLEGRKELSVLWDIRVHPGARGQGIGTRLFRHAMEWSRLRGCTQMKVETQNINVRACRFYAAQGCTLGSIHRFGYANVPSVAHEAMLLWYIDLSRSAISPGEAKHQ